LIVPFIVDFISCFPYLYGEIIEMRNIVSEVVSMIPIFFHVIVMCFLCIVDLLLLVSFGYQNWMIL